MQLKYLALLLSIFTSSLVMAVDKNCVDCGMKDVEGMPVNKSLAQLERIVRSAGAEEPREATKNESMEDACIKFTQTGKESVGRLINEFEKSKYPADDYFLQANCQPEGYSRNVKSPIIHHIAETPISRATFLNSIWLYYSKKRKEPEMFTKILNFPNTKGESILDYIESLKKIGKNISPELQEPTNTLINFICSHGGAYLTNKDKSCPK